MADILSQSQIDALLNDLISSSDSSSDSNKMGSNGNNEDMFSYDDDIKSYDFSSPKKVTRENLKLITSVYEGYSRIMSSYLSAVLRMFCETEIKQVEESIFYEYNNALSDSVLMCVVDFVLPDTKKSCGQVLLNVSKTLAFSIIDKLMGGDGDDFNYERDFTDIELSILDNLLRQITTKMQEAWKNTVPILIEFNRIETNARFIQSIGYNDSVLLVILDMAVKGLVDKFTICIPTMTIDQIFKRSEDILLASKKEKIDEEALADKESIMGSLKASALNVSGVLGGTMLSLHDVLNIQIGDVIVLDDKTYEDVTITVDDKPWFSGKWGAKRKNNAIRINEVLY